MKKLLYLLPIMALLAAACGSAPAPTTQQTPAPQPVVQTTPEPQPTAVKAPFHCTDLLSEQNFEKFTGKSRAMLEVSEELEHKDVAQLRCLFLPKKDMDFQANFHLSIVVNFGVDEDGKDPEAALLDSKKFTLEYRKDVAKDRPDCGCGLNAYTFIDDINFLSSNKKYSIRVSFKYLFGDEVDQAKADKINIEIAKIVDANLNKY